MTTEPLPTAITLAAAGLLLALSVLASRASRRLGVPVVLIFLAVGMAAGSEGLGRIPFEDYGFAFRFGTAALTLILFDGGLNTPMRSLRLGLGPASVLATAGVVLTAGLVGLGAWLLGVPWGEALLLGAVVSSTDAAAVFTVLRASGLHLRKRLGATLELESGLNDPMAVILTLGLTAALVEDRWPGPWMLVSMLVQLAVGAGAGLGLGLLGRWVLRRFALPAGGLYPVLTIAVALVAFGLPTVLFGSGFLAVYVAGMVLGNGELPYQAGVLRVHDAIAWFSQVAMFVVLGLLVFPSRLAAVAGEGLVIAAILVFVARPAAVTACLAPFGFAPKEVAYVGWVGLRGAVPIILATFPVLAGAPGATGLFDLVFFVVVTSSLLQGGTVPWLTSRLGLEVREPPPPPAVLEMVATQPLRGRVLHFFVDAATAAAGSRIVELPFPPDSAVMLVVRGQRLVAPRGGTVLRPGDHVYVIAQPDDEPLIRLVFGRPGEV